MEILNYQELLNAVSQEGNNTAELLRQQCATLNLLSDTQTMSFGINSTLFTGMLGELMIQSGFASAQLGEQQLYDAASLEGAAATYLLLDILSGNVGSMVEKLNALANFSQGLLTKAEELPALLEKLGGEKSDITKSVDILTGGLGALSSIEGAQKLFSQFSRTGIMGLFSSLLSGPALPLIIGAITVAMGGFFALKALKTGIGKDQEKAPSGAGAAASSDASSGGNAEEDLAEKDLAKEAPPLVVDPTDPFKTGAGDESNYNQYQGQIEGSRQTADTLREAVRVGNDEVVARLDAVATALQRLAEKPADRHIKSEVVIQSLSTSMTFSEFRDKLNEVLERETQTAP